MCIRDREKEASNIRRFVEGGGIFVTSFRLGVKDESSQIVRTPLPGLLRDVMGVTVKDYVPIYSEKIGVKFSPQLAGPDGECALWADLLQPSSASVLATYTEPYAGEPAITINSFGKGKAIYLGADSVSYTHLISHWSYLHLRAGAISIYGKHAVRSRSAFLSRFLTSLCSA